MTEHENSQPTDPVDCTDETAQRAGAKKSSLNEPDPGEDGETKPAKPDIDKDNVSEADLDEAIEETMDASDPPAYTQP